MADNRDEAGRDDAGAFAGPDGDSETVAGEVRGLFEAARARAETEIEFQKARAGLLGKWVGIAAGLGCLVLALLFVALMAALLGIILGLAQLVGPWAAAGIVVGVLLLAALAAGLIVWRRVRRIAALFGERP